ncbi:MAG: hypothetical protein ACLPV8_01190 [Steroidobacteraceae bacterium]
MSKRTLSDAIDAAALSLMPSGRRFPHQRRISRTVLEESRRALIANMASLAAAVSFEALHAEIKRIVGSIHGIGELYIYDTAVRIGAKRGLPPDRVYLHAGVRVGVRNLGLDPTLDSVDVKDMPQALHRLAPYEIEDVLCIYKDQLAGAVLAERSTENCSFPSRGCR